MPERLKIVLMLIGLLLLIAAGLFIRYGFAVWFIKMVTE